MHEYVQLTGKQIPVHPPGKARSIQAVILPLTAGADSLLLLIDTQLIHFACDGAATVHDGGRDAPAARRAAASRTTNQALRKITALACERH